MHANSPIQLLSYLVRTTNERSVILEIIFNYSGWWEIREQETFESGQVRKFRRFKIIRLQNHLQNVSASFAMVQFRHRVELPRGLTFLIAIFIVPHLSLSNVPRVTVEVSRAMPSNYSIDSPEENRDISSFGKPVVKMFEIARKSCFPTIAIRFCARAFGIVDILNLYFIRFAVGAIHFCKFTYIMKHISN